MHIIRSNPWGFRIHSPFVYKLVTTGLFRKQDRREKKIIYPESFFPVEKKYTEQILNLIRFLQPVEIVTSGGDNPVHKWIIDQSLQQPPEQVECRDEQSIRCRRIILSSGLPQVLKPEHSNDVWVMTGMNNKIKRSTLNISLHQDEVRVIVESDFLAILFFHPLLQKEHYIIHRWFYL